MTGPERQRLPAGAGERDHAFAQAWHLDARHRPGIGRGPGLDVVTAQDGRREGALKQNLRDQSFGLDVKALPDQRKPERAEQDRQRRDRRTSCHLRAGEHH